MNMYCKYIEKKDGIGGNIIRFINYFTICNLHNYKMCNITFKHIVNISILPFLNFDKFNQKIIEPANFVTINNDVNNNNIKKFIESDLQDKIRDSIKIDEYNECKKYFDKINIGVHIRRGDIYYRLIDDPIYRNKYYNNSKKKTQKKIYRRRFIELKYYINIMNIINNIYGKESVIFHIFSTGEEHEFKDLSIIDNKIMYISEPNHQETYYKKNGGEIPICQLISTMIESDILICSKSNLSLSCATLTKNFVIFPNWMWRYENWGYFYKEPEKYLEKWKKAVIEKVKNRMSVKTI